MSQQQRQLPPTQRTSPMAYTFILSRDGLNRNGYQVLTSGIDTRNFEKNPVLLVQHVTWSDDQPPIGRVENVRKVTAAGVPALVGDLVFASTEDGQKFKQLVDDGALNAVSIGFRVHETSSDPKDLLPGQYSPTATKCELLEVSLVTLPGNADAVRVPDGTLSMDSQPENKPADGTATLAGPVAGAILSLALAMEATQPDAAPTPETAPATAQQALTLEAMMAFMTQQFAALEQRLLAQAPPAPHNTPPDASEKAGSGAANAADPAPVATPARPTLAAAIEQELAGTRTQGAVVENKESFDWLQRNNPAELARIKREEIVRYNALVTDYLNS